MYFDRGGFAFELRRVGYVYCITQHSTARHEYEYE